MTLPSMDPGCAAVALAGALHDLLQRSRSPLVDTFLQDWPPAMRASREITPSLIPPARRLEQLREAAPAFASRFVALLAEQVSQLAWRQSYSAPQAGAHFMAEYGYCEIVGGQAAVASTRLAAGVLLLGPHTHYAAHWHEAEEIYLPLVGAAHWWQGILPWQLEYPGAQIHHARFEPHAMRTTAAPLLAIYLWRSEDLAQTSQLVSGTCR